MSSESCPKSKKEIKKMSHVSYSSAVCSLMYAMVYTRPDLSYVVSVMSRFMHNPGKDCWDAMK